MEVAALSSNGAVDTDRSGPANLSSEVEQCIVVSFGRARVLGHQLSGKCPHSVIQVGPPATVERKEPDEVSCHACVYDGNGLVVGKAQDRVSDVRTNSGEGDELMKGGRYFAVLFVEQCSRYIYQLLGSLVMKPEGVNLSGQLRRRSSG